MYYVRIYFENKFAKQVRRLVKLGLPGRLPQPGQSPRREDRVELHHGRGSLRAPEAAVVKEVLLALPLNLVNICLGIAATVMTWLVGLPHPFLWGMLAADELHTLSGCRDRYRDTLRRRLHSIFWA
jgi:hypothetical protein